MSTQSNIEYYTSDAVSPAAAFSIAAGSGPLIFTAGQTGAPPADRTTPDAFSAEVERAIDKLELVLAAAGSDLDHVVKTTCFITDGDRFDEFDSVYRERFREPLPARSTVIVGLAGGYRFEIEAIAVKMKKR